jgi:hypothetical protein
MARLGFSLSMFGGIWFMIIFFFLYIQGETMFPYWDPPLWFGALPYLAVGVFCVSGVIIGKNYVKTGSITCFIAGVGYLLLQLIFDVITNSLLLMSIFIDFIGSFYISVPMLLVLIGGILALIELLREK